MQRGHVSGWRDEWYHLSHYNQQQVQATGVKQAKWVRLQKVLGATQLQGLPITIMQLLGSAHWSAASTQGGVMCQVPTLT
jgi:hypothetical protein